MVAARVGNSLPLGALALSASANPCSYLTLAEAGKRVAMSYFILV
jgi:hypothetical protein